MAHFFETDRGFKLVRFFHLPDSIVKAFQEDEFSGDHLIEKCTSDRTLPRGFDEVKVNLALVGGSVEVASLGKALILINPDYSELTAEGYPNWSKVPAHRSYSSFHPWPWFSIVTQIGEQSIIKALTNFDRAIAFLNPQTALERKELVLTEGESHFPALPPAYQ